MPIDFTTFQPLDFRPWAQPDTGITYQRPQPQRAPDVMPGGVGFTSPDEVPDATLAYPGGGGASFPGPAGVAPSAPPTLSRMGRLAQSIKSHLSGDAPQGYEEAFAQQLMAQGVPEAQARAQAAREVEAARPGLLPSLFPAPDQPNAHAAWQRNLETLLQKRTLSGNLYAQRVIDQKTQDILAKNPAPKPGATAEEYGKWADGVIPQLLAIGNYKAVERLTPLAAKPKEPGKDVGEYWRNKDTGEIQSFSKEAGTKIPKGWEKITSANAGDYQTWIDPKAGKYYAIPKNEVGPPGTKPDVDFRNAFTQENVNARSLRSYVRGSQNDFERTVSTYVKTANSLDKALYTLDRAQHAKDAQERRDLYGAIYSQYVQSADQPTGLRYQLLQYYEHHVDPSLFGSARIFLAKLKNGELPPDVLQGLVTHLQGLQRQTYRQIEKHRDEFLRTHSQLDDEDLPTTASRFEYGLGLDKLKGTEKSDPTLDVSGPSASNNATQSVEDRLKSLGIIPVAPVRKP